MSSLKRSEVDAVGDAVIDWAESRKLHRPFRGAVERFDELFKGALPAEALDALYGQCVLSKVTASAKNRRKCVRESREQYVESFAGLLQQLLQQPWQMAVFRVVKLHGGGRLTVRIVEEEPEAGDERVMMSPTVEDLYRRGERLFGSLLIDAGEELHTFGGVFYYQAFDEDDIRQFARTADAAMYRSKGLQAVLSAYPVEFVGLYAFARQPRSRMAGEEMRFCQSRASMAGLSFEDLAAERPDLEADRKPPFFRLSSEATAAGESGFSHNFVVVGDDSRQVAWLYSFLRSGYDAGRAALQPLLEFPAEPDFRLSVGMVSAMEALLSFETGVEQIERELVTENTPEQAAFIENLNRAIGRLSHAANTGQQIDQRFIEQVAAEEGIDPADLARLSSQLGTEEKSKQLRNDFFGISPEMMQRILYGGWEDITDIVEIRKPLNVKAEDAPVLASAAGLIELLASEGPIGEVPYSGNLPKEVADQFSLQPVRGEESVPYLHLARILLELSGIIEHSEGFFRLTGQIGELFEGSRDSENKLDIPQLYLTLLNDFMEKFNWEYLYEMNAVEMPLVRVATPFLLHTLRSLPDITARRVNQVLLQAFPSVVQEITTRLAEHYDSEPLGLEEVSEITEDAVYSQFFMQLLQMFGLAKTAKRQRSASAATRWRLTSLFEQVFDWKIPAF
ncbi:MAG: hypothetical protein ACOCZA_13160 [Spirochaetota bacterium]